jgi:hypothetical protein
MIFGIGQGASLGFKHHRDTIPNRIGKPITPANEFRMIRIWVESSLAKRAD